MTEKQLSEKGYRPTQNFDTMDKAKENAKEMRAQGYKATAKRCTTRVKGYYNYWVFVKR